MTPRARAIDIVMTEHVSVEDIEQAIIAAIEEERGACAEIAEAWVRPSMGMPDADAWAAVAGKIARKIRARSDTK